MAAISGSVDMPPATLRVRGGHPRRPQRRGHRWLCTAGGHRHPWC